MMGYNFLRFFSNKVSIVASSISHTLIFGGNASPTMSETVEFGQKTLGILGFNPNISSDQIGVAGQFGQFLIYLFIIFSSNFFV
jgi:hypothetical protein